MERDLCWQKRTESYVCNDNVDGDVRVPQSRIVIATPPQIPVHMLQIVNQNAVGGKIAQRSSRCRSKIGMHLVENPRVQLGPPSSRNCQKQ